MLLGFSFSASAFPSAGGIRVGNKAKPLNLTWLKAMHRLEVPGGSGLGWWVPSLGHAPIPPGAGDISWVLFLPGWSLSCLTTICAVQAVVTSERFSSLFSQGESNANLVTVAPNSWADVQFLCVWAHPGVRGMSRGLFNTFGMPRLRVREHVGGGRGCGRELGMLWGNWGCCCIRQKRSPVSSQDFLFSLCNHQQNSLCLAETCDVVNFRRQTAPHRVLGP